MAKLEELNRDVNVRGILPNSLVTLVDVKWSGSEAVTVIYKEDNSDRVGSCLLYRWDESRLEIVKQTSRWGFDADGALFRLVSEAQRIRLTHLFNPYLAIHSPLIDLTLESYRDILKQGSILIDENDPGDRIRVLVYLEHAIRDARQDATGNSRTVSVQMLYVEIDSQGQAYNAGFAPYLDYRPLLESEKALATDVIRLASSIVQKEIEEQAQAYAISQLGRQHYQEVKQQRIERITKTINSLQTRLNAEINFWSDKAEKLKLQNMAGQANGKVNYETAKRRLDELKGRLQKRLQELEQERQLLPQRPVVVGGALIVTPGLIKRLQAYNQNGFSNLATEKEYLEKQAIAAVMAAEKKQGFEPKDVSTEKYGFDIESCIPNNDKIRFIKIKIQNGTGTICFSKTEIMTALNNPDSFILALVQRHELANKFSIRYLHRPFHRNLDAVINVQYKWQQFWQLGREM